MKKILALLAIVAAVTAPAASIDWGLSLGRNGFIADSTGAPLQGTLYLILTSDASALAAAAEKDTFANDIDSIALGSLTTNASGKNTAVQTATDDRLVARSAGGPQYSFAIVTYDAANKQYFVSDALAQYAYLSGTDDTTQITFANDKVGNLVSASATWSSSVPVPEPGIACMALLGIGMMIKRRRA